MVVPEWKRETVAGSDGTRLAVWRTGAGPEKVLCVHGISAQSRSFNALASALAGESVEIVAVDLRGRGDSEKPESGYGLEAHARDVLRVLDHLGLDEAKLCGHSMGAFVILEVARTNPERVRSLVLLDGGWPRKEEGPGEEEERAVSEGLKRAFSRLDMTFESPEAYLDFWFPGQNLSPEDLPPELADYYLYDLKETESGYTPKTSRLAAEQDSASVSSGSMTAGDLKEVSPPVALIRAAEGFFPGSAPLISEEARQAMAGSLDIREEVFLEGANHYTMLWEPFTGKWARLVSSDFSG